MTANASTFAVTVLGASALGSLINNTLNYALLTTCGTGIQISYNQISPATAFLAPSDGGSSSLNLSYALVTSNVGALKLCWCGQPSLSCIAGQNFNVQVGSITVYGGVNFKIIVQDSTNPCNRI